MPSAASMVLLDGGARIAATVVGASLCLALGCLLKAQPRFPNERRPWNALATAVLLVSLGLALEAGAGILLQGPPTERSGGTGFAIVGLAFCSFFYHGITISNPMRSDQSDSADWVNGVCAVLVATAAGGLVLAVVPTPMSTWPDLPRQLWLVNLAVLLVMGGSATTVGKLAGLATGLRLHVLAAACALLAAGQLAAGTTLGVEKALAGAQAGWICVSGVIAFCSLMPPHKPDVIDDTSQSATVGSLVVALSGCLTVGALALWGHDRTSSIVLAVTASVASGLRLSHLISSLAQLAHTRRQAHTDDLTGALNRRALTKSLAAVARSGRPAALLVIDLDRFKDINDRYGHTVGDEVLVVLAERITSVLPPGAQLSRHGGDEFAVLALDVDLAEAVALAERIASACHPPVPTSVGPRALELSVGVAVNDVAARGAGELMRRADIAMYVAKESGGGIAVFDDDADRRAQRRQERLDELRVVLAPEAERSEELGSIEVFYQPQIDIGTGRVVGAEALARWRHPREGLLAPDAFLDLVERHGLMAHLTRSILGQAVRDAVQWRRDGHDLHVSVNLSASCLDHPDLVPTVEAELERRQLPAEALVLEITESTLMRHPQHALATMRELADLGVGMSIDDYGTGYSSLAYLTDLPAVELKLDRSFTARLMSHQPTEAVVLSTIELAHGLGLRMVAEGVEDVETFERLNLLGCDQSQGYLHARPMDRSASTTWLGGHAQSIDGAAFATEPFADDAAVDAAPV